MILVSRSGLMCAVTIVRETPKAWVLSELGVKKDRRVPKNDERRRLFNNTDEARDWLRSLI